MSNKKYEYSRSIHESNLNVQQIIQNLSKGNIGFRLMFVDCPIKYNELGYFYDFYSTFVPTRVYIKY